MELWLALLVYVQASSHWRDLNVWAYRGICVLVLLQLARGIFEAGYELSAPAKVVLQCTETLLAGLP